LRSPPARIAAAWSDVRDAAAGPIVTKATDGTAGRGAGVAAILDGAPVSPMFAGPWMIQKFVDGDGFVRKIYVAGRHVRALVKAAG